MFEDQNLPQLDADTSRHCDLVLDAIRREIVAKGGAIRFDDFMRIALYEPGLGYYLAGARKFGADGDFVTAPELGPLFGAALAEQCKQVICDIPGAEIVEFGGGSGKLAVSLLSALAAQEALPERYNIIELSPELRARQQQLIAEELPELTGRVYWLSAPPALPISGCVIANEILDALPVRAFVNQGGEILEHWVKLDESEELAWEFRPADDTIHSFLNSESGFDTCLQSDGYRFEICASIPLWIADLATKLHSGLALLIDYGSGRRDRYGPSLAQGSLRCFLQHRVHGQPLVFPGGQDITASVDFTHVAEAAVDAGLHVAGYVEQVHFLTSCGILQKVTEFQAEVDENTAFAFNEQLKTLLMPAKMGTRFKVLALTKEYDAPLTGFAARDDRRLL